MASPPVIKTLPRPMEEAAGATTWCATAKRPTQPVIGDGQPSGQSPPNTEQLQPCGTRDRRRPPALHCVVKTLSQPMKEDKEHITWRFTSMNLMQPVVGDKEHCVQPPPGTEQLRPRGAAPPL